MRKQILRRFFLNSQPLGQLLLVSLLSCSRLLAQEAGLDHGFKPFGSYQHGDIDSISLSNGNVILHIPIASYPQRGKLDLSFSIIYNNKAWKEETVVDGTLPPILGGCPQALSPGPTLRAI